MSCRRTGSPLNGSGLNDSIWEQYKAVRRTFNTYLTTPMHREHNAADATNATTATNAINATNATMTATTAINATNAATAAGLDGSWSVPAVGFIMGMPGSVLEAGEAKVPGGYSETTYSLPRCTQHETFNQR